MGSNEVNEVQQERRRNAVRLSSFNPATNRRVNELERRVAASEQYVESQRSYSLEQRER